MATIKISGSGFVSIELGVDHVEKRGPAFSCIYKERLGN